jgi:hypothetical protein
MVRGLVEAASYPDNPKPLAGWAQRVSLVPCRSPVVLHICHSMGANPDVRGVVGSDGAA